MITLFLLILQITLTPLLVGSVTIIEHRYNSTVSGLLVGLPLTTGPVMFFLTVEYGSYFTLESLTGVILSVTSTGAFCMVYSKLSGSYGWKPTLIASWATFTILPLLLGDFVHVFSFGLVIAVVFLSISLALTQSYPLQRTTPIDSTRDTLSRITSSTAIVVLVSAFGATLGPLVSGILANTPIFLSIFAVFNHRNNGVKAVRNFLRGAIVGSFSYALFFVVLEETLASFPLYLSFVFSAVAALTLNGMSMFVTQRRKSERALAS